MKLFISGLMMFDSKALWRGRKKGRARQLTRGWKCRNCVWKLRYTLIWTLCRKTHSSEKVNFNVESFRFGYVAFFVCFFINMVFCSLHLFCSLILYLSSSLFEWLSSFLYCVFASGFSSFFFIFCFSSSIEMKWNEIFHLWYFMRAHCTQAHTHTIQCTALIHVVT